VILYHGSPDAREFLVAQEFYCTDQFVTKSRATKLKRRNITKFHILITTVEIALKDIQILSRVKWRALVVDEAYLLKNPKARLFEEHLSVPRDYCLLLTGTPIADATQELFALLKFANPSTRRFLGKFGEMKEANQVSELHSILKLYLLRGGKKTWRNHCHRKKKLLWRCR
jgi:SNF2 family DNA or RNA helicase